MKYPQQLWNRILSWMKYPLKYYRQLFDIYRLEEVAKEVPYPPVLQEGQTSPFSLILLDWGEDHLRKLFFNALKKQEVLPSEIILIQQTGDPGLFEFKATLAKEFQLPVMVITTSQDFLGSTWNQAFQVAEHEQIVFADSNFIPNSDWLSSLTNPLQQDSEIDLCLGRFSAQLYPILRQLVQTYSRSFSSIRDFRTSLSIANSFSIRKRNWARAGGFPVMVPEGTENSLFWMRIKKQYLNYTVSENVLGDCIEPGFDNGLLNKSYTRAKNEGKLGLFAQNIWSQLIYLVFLTAIVFGSLVVSLIIPSLGLFCLGILLIGLFITFLIWGKRGLSDVKFPGKIRWYDYLKVGFVHLIEVAGYLVGVFDRDQSRQNFQETDKQQVLRIVKAHQKKVKGVVVYFPTHDWGFMFQRPQQIARHFAQEGYLFFYGTKNETADNVANFQQVEENLILFSVPPETFQILEKPILYLGSAWFASLLPLYNKATLIYDHYDSLKMSSGRIEDHITLLEQADLVLVSSKDLITEAKTHRSEILFVPNAVDYKFVVSCKSPDKSSLPEDLARILERKKPIIGFVGALAEWCDYELMIQSANTNPQWEFLYIGSDYDGSVNKTELLNQSNVSWIGPKPYQELFQYLWEFDVATIPFKINEMTIAMNPVKLFEYFACQKPVVTTPLPECQHYPEVLIARDTLEFSNQIQKALELATLPGFQSRMDQLAKQNTWKDRVKVILEHVDLLNSSGGGTN